MHDAKDLIAIFNACFASEYNTRLVKGGDQPLYLPANRDCAYHALYFAHGFFSSALHECSHWLIAGHARRMQVDFGYWYSPDGRTPKEQQLFQQMEVKPQAMEWIMSMAAGSKFYISLDNLNGEMDDTQHFINAIIHQVKVYCEQGLPARAQKFRLALCQFYTTEPALDSSAFTANSL